MYYAEGTRRGVSPPHTTLAVVTPPTIEPMELADAKRYLRIVTEDENHEVLQWIGAARRFVEQQTGLCLLTQTLDVFVDDVPADYWFQVPTGPLQSVTSINITDPLNAETVWLSTNYVVDVARRRIALTNGVWWPGGLRTFSPVRIRLVAGWTSPALIPSDLMQAFGLALGWFAENRQPGPFDRAMFDQLCAPYWIPAAA